MSGPSAYSAWIGRSETAVDHATPGPIARLAALLDYAAPPWRAGEVPPLAHWFNFVPAAPQSEIDHDGHPRRGGFLPPITLPRRMWAGSRLHFHNAIAIGARLERRSQIIDVISKDGVSGELVFVKLRHEILTADTLAIVEEQDVVYRAAPTKPDASAPPPASDRAGARPSEFTRTVRPDSVQLFRYSALTFNGHRIHYDRDYAREEGYPGLVVHGPFVATLLMDHFRRHKPEALVKKFDIRLQLPLFDTESFELCLAQTAIGVDLWAARRGQVTASAKIEYV